MIIFCLVLIIFAVYQVPTASYGASVFLNGMAGMVLGIIAGIIGLVVLLVRIGFRGGRDIDFDLGDIGGSD